MSLLTPGRGTYKSKRKRVSCQLVVQWEILSRKRVHKQLPRCAKPTSLPKSAKEGPSQLGPGMRKKGSRGSRKGTLGEGRNGPSGRKMAGLRLT